MDDKFRDWERRREAGALTPAELAGFGYALVRVGREEQAAEVFAEVLRSNQSDADVLRRYLEIGKHVCRLRRSSMREIRYQSAYGNDRVALGTGEWITQGDSTVWIPEAFLFEKKGVPTCGYHVYWKETRGGGWVSGLNRVEAGDPKRFFDEHKVKLSVPLDLGMIISLDKRERWSEEDDKDYCPM